MDEGDTCPECGGYVTIIDDTGLPPTLGNAECENPDCHYWVEGVEL